MAKVLGDWPGSKATRTSSRPSARDEEEVLRSNRQPTPAPAFSAPKPPTPAQQNVNRAAQNAFQDRLFPSFQALQQQRDADAKARGFEDPFPQFENSIPSLKPTPSPNRDLWPGLLKEAEAAVGRFAAGDTDAMTPFTGDNVLEKVQAAQKDRDMRARLQQEREQFGAGLRQGGYGFVAKELSWDEYDALSPQQRAAIDANTAISKAVQMDKAHGKSNAGDTEYDALVNQLFGEHGGSDTYAPNTVAVLDALGLSNTATGDLDDYLDGAALVSMNDLSALSNLNMEEYQYQSGSNARLTNAMSFSTQATKRLAETLQAGQSLLDAARNSEFGAKQLGAQTPQIGFNPTNPRDALMQDLFDIMAQRSSADLPDDRWGSWMLGLMAEYPELDSTALQDFFETKLKAYDYGVAAGKTPALGADPSADYLTPEEFRQRYYQRGK